MRLLMAEPNVLLLDEPTNDLDIDTLAALEDLLDGWPGTLVVVSHDRYFVERVCDNVYALTADGGIRHLPGGIDQYVELLARQASPRPRRAPSDAQAETAPHGRDAARARKQVQRIERALDRIADRETALHDAMAAARPTTRSARSCRPSSRHSPPSARGSRPRGWRPRRRSRPEPRGRPVPRPAILWAVTAPPPGPPSRPPCRRPGGWCGRSPSWSRAGGASATRSA